MLYINKFVDRLRHIESRAANDFTCSLTDAKNLHSDITKLLSELHDLQEKIQHKDEVVQVEVTGGKF